ncbi:MAG: helix-turn-helix domain-containing protein [Gordonia sp. (in: high G+C Gram-positive bacteria)]
MAVGHRGSGQRRVRVEDDPVWTPEDAGKYLSVSPETLRYWRYEGRGPEFCRMGGRLIRYRKSALDRFVEESVVEQAPESPARLRRR